MTAAENGLFHIFTYCGILRRYETPEVILHDLRHHILSLEESAVLAERGGYLLPTYLYPFWGALRPDPKRRNAALFISIGITSLEFNQQFGHRY